MDGGKAVVGGKGLRRHILGGGLPHAGGHQLDHGVVRNELEAVLVTGDRHAVPSRRLTLAGDGADEIVGLVARQLVSGDAHGVQQLLEKGHLLRQLLRHSLALGLVALVGEVAEGGFPAVKGDAQGLGLLLLQKAQQGGDKAVYRVGGQALPGGKGPHAVKRAVDDAVAVDDHEFHCCFLLRR